MTRILAMKWKVAIIGLSCWKASPMGPLWTCPGKEVGIRIRR